MQQNGNFLKRRFLKGFSALVLLAALLGVSACGGGSGGKGGSNSEDGSNGPSVTFTFEAVPMAGDASTFTVKTDKDSVGAALLAEGLVAGDEGDYGLYVTVVNGVTADFNVDGTYWAFYIDGEYAMTGVGVTTPVDGAVYALKQEK